MIPGKSSLVQLHSPYFNAEIKKGGEINSSIPRTWEYEMITFNQELFKGKCIFPC